MKPHRLVALSAVVVLSSTFLFAVTAQSPNSAPPRGKNGRTPESSPGEGKGKVAEGAIKPGQESSQRQGTDRVPQRIGESTSVASENVRLAVDLVVLDAQVLQQKTGRIIGNLKKEDFVVTEDGVQQEITHFGQDTLPLSVILLIDRGGCLDPFSDKVRHATLEALQRLRPQDEVALMSFANTTELIAGFGHGKDRILAGLNSLPPHDEEAEHCVSRAFHEAANYMKRAGNPDGRRVILMITGVTAFFDCPGPSPEEARMAVFESGSVVCGIIPKTAGQRIENGIMIAAAGVGGLFKAKTSNLKQLAEETGGEVLTDKPENLDRTFNDLIDHLRTRYTLGFVSTNRKRDGSFRKLKVQLTRTPQPTDGKLVVKTKRGYVAAKDATRDETPRVK
jgi:VWFA-related protein